jgi:hypothetical protein
LFCCKEDQVNIECYSAQTLATNLFVREEAENAGNNPAQIQQQNLNHITVSKAFE